VERGQVRTALRSIAPVWEFVASPQGRGFPWAAMSSPARVPATKKGSRALAVQFVLDGLAGAGIMP
jgi:hypothetical protein